MITDPIANFIVTLKNAAHAGSDVVVVPHSKKKEAIAEVLKKVGYLSGVSVKGKNKNKLEVVLAQEDGEAKIKGVKRISKPSKRVYKKAAEMMPVKNGYGHLIVSTPAGMTTGSDAKKKKVGGEVLFEIW